MISYAFPPGGLPGQDVGPEGAAIFTEAYAFIPAITMRDIVTSFFPGWRDSRGWIIARPLSGFAETFAQYAMEVAPGGGSDMPEPDAAAQGVLFVADGTMLLEIDDNTYELEKGGYAYIPAGSAWRIEQSGQHSVAVSLGAQAISGCGGLVAARTFCHLGCGNAG